MHPKRIDSSMKWQVFYTVILVWETSLSTPEAKKAIAGSLLTLTMLFESEILPHIQQRRRLYVILTMFSFRECDSPRLQGTWRYMSRNVLEGEGPHTYLDDLESFYFVLTWILMVYSGPRKAKVILPDVAEFWDDPDSSTLKRGHFGLRRCSVSVDPWFGPCFQALTTGLFDFFRIRRLDLGKPLSALNPAKDYAEYIGCIQQCILDMEVEDLAVEQCQTSPSAEDLLFTIRGNETKDTHPIPT
jgi:Fungal protein kinase